MKHPDISVVVACRDERQHIEEFVNSVLAQETGRYTMEVLVADGMSTDGTRQLLDTLCAGDPRVTVLDNPGRIVSTGLNAAIEAARGARRPGSMRVAEREEGAIVYVAGDKRPGTAVRAVV